MSRPGNLSADIAGVGDVAFDVIGLNVRFYICRVAFLSTHIACISFSHVLSRQPIAVSDISVYICLIDIRDGSCRPVYGGVDRLKALISAKTGCRSRFFMN